MEEVSQLTDLGINVRAPTADVNNLHRQQAPGNRQQATGKSISKLTGRLAAVNQRRKINIARGRSYLVGKNHDELKKQKAQPRTQSTG